MAKIQTETAAQLFCRLGAKRSLHGLDRQLFFHLNKPIQAQDIIELYGDNGCGKTAILLHVIANCILPEFWKGVCFNGCNAGVVLIDTEQKFSVMRLMAVLEHRLCDAVAVAMNADEENISSLQKLLSAVEAEAFVKNCFTRLHLISCDSSLQLLASLYSLDSFLKSNPDICLLAIDSISCFYWSDKLSGRTKHQQEENLRAIASVLKRLVNVYFLILIVTKQEIFMPTQESDSSKSRRDKFSKREGFEYLCSDWVQLVSYRFWLQQENSSDATSPGVSSFSLKLTGQHSLGSGSVQFSVTKKGVEVQ